MFDLIRNHRRWMQFILLILIVPAFAFFGIEGYVGFMSRDRELATVDGIAITQPEYDMARRNQLEQMRSMLGPQFDPQAIDTPAFRQRVLNDLITQRVIAAAAMKGRYTVSDEMLRDTIAQIPAVQENGVFSPTLYRRVLASQGMTPAEFEMGLRRDLILSQVLAPIGATAQPPRQVVDRLAAALTEQRTVAVRRFETNAYESDVTVTDEDVKAWYDANSPSLLLPESVDLEYVVLDEAAATQGVSVPDAEIQAFYRQNQARYGQPERRRVRHILREVPVNADPAQKAAVREEALAIEAQLKASPDAFASLAQAQSQDPGSANQGGDLGWVAKDTLVPEVERAVFDLQPGVISGVVESPFGFHVIEVTDIQPASIKPLEDVRDDVTTEIRRQLAAARFADLASELTGLVYDQRDALAPIAAQVGLTLQSAQGLTRDGLLPDSLFARQAPLEAATIDILNQPRVRQVAFSADVFNDRNNSGLIELAPDTMVVVRVSAVRPASVPPLEQVSALIRERLLMDKALNLAREAGKASLAAIQSGTTPEGFQAAEVVSRQDARDLLPAELSAVMLAKVEHVPGFVGIDTARGYTLLHIQGVSPGEAMSDQERALFASQLAQAWGSSEEMASLDVLKTVFEVKVLPDARALIDSAND
jgi:peptidyl-prolyl cis-trans isomerase D